ncbi:MAG: exodeoxyribonuclease III [Deltaproteobacteria bacterium]|nr:MAG: exodeoxyribonuclease III [Deltaproteobacteria bacterium]
MKIATWNVNSIRVRLQAVLDWMEQAGPDILCLQETKVTDEQFPVAVFEAMGYQVAVSGQKTYNGVAIISRYDLEDVLVGFPDYAAEGQKRLLAATVSQVRVVNAYIPNGAAPDSEKFVYKLEFIDQLRNYLQELHVPEEWLILTGDFNIAPEARDVYDAEAMEGAIGFHPKERTALKTLRHWGLEDTFRKHHIEDGLYSWWDYRAGAFRRDMGLRIDHIWATPPLAVSSTASGMDKEQRSLSKPSDHIPVWTVFDISSLGKSQT